MSLIESLRRIQLEWSLSEDQMASLLHITAETYRSWLAPESVQATSNATIPPGMETAASLFTIYKRLSGKLPDAEKQAKWMLAPHPDFDGNKPIDIAASSRENLLWLAYYLESSLR